MVVVVVVAAGAAVSTTNHGWGVDDLLTLNVGGNSVTISQTGQSETSTALADIGDALVSAWVAKYGSTGTASNSAIATLVDTNGSIAITMNDIGSGGFNLPVSLSATSGLATSTNGANLTWVIGTSTSASDNSTVAADVIVTIESIAAGTGLNAVGLQASSLVVSIARNTGTTTTIRELFSTKLTNGTDTTAPYTESFEARSDVRVAEGTRASVGETTPAVSYSRLGWL
mgnify:CR=1 FL=1